MTRRSTTSKRDRESLFGWHASLVPSGKGGVSESWRPGVSSRRRLKWGKAGGSRSVPRGADGRASRRDAPFLEVHSAEDGAVLRPHLRI